MCSYYVHIVLQIQSPFVTEPCNLCPAALRQMCGEAKAPVLNWTAQFWCTTATPARQNVRLICTGAKMENHCPVLAPSPRTPPSGKRHIWEILFKKSIKKCFNFVWNIHHMHVYYVLLWNNILKNWVDLVGSWKWPLSWSLQVHRQRPADGEQRSDSETEGKVRFWSLFMWNMEQHNHLQASKH